MAIKKLKIIQLATSSNKEVAADVPQMGDDPAIDNVLMELFRANTILDSKKDKLFFDHLTIGSKTQAQRAIQAYDEDYLLRLPLSLSAIQELAKELIRAAAIYKLSPSPSWTRLSGGTFRLDVMNADLEDTEDTVADSERVGADI